MPTQSLLTPESVQLIGGLDFVTPRPSVTPGALLDCYNFEVADRLGYKSMDGIERFDGSVSSSGTFNSLYSFTCTSTYVLNAGEYLWDSDLDKTKAFGVIVSIENVRSFLNCVNFIVTDFNKFSDVLIKLAAKSSITFDCSNSATGITVSTIDEYTRAHSSDSLFVPKINSIATVADSVAKVSTENYNAEVFKTSCTTIDNTPSTQIPNQAIGLHWFKEHLYAVNDLDSFYFDTGSFEILPNDQITIGGSGTIYIVRDIAVSSGTWENSDAAGKILFTYDPASNAQPKSISTASSFTIGDSISVSRGTTSESAAAKISSSTYTAVPTWYAGLSYAQNDDDLKQLTNVRNKQGFLDVEMGYNFSFNSGTSNGPPKAAIRDSTVQHSAILNSTASVPSTIVSPSPYTVGASGGANVAYVYNGASAVQSISAINDGNYIRNSGYYTVPLRLSGLVFDNVPSDALITGIQITLNYFKYSGLGTGNGVAATISIDGTTFSSEKRTPIVVSTSSSSTDQATLGSLSDTWGLTGIKASNINDLVISLYTYKPAPQSYVAMAYDSISVVVSYQQVYSVYYFNDGTDDVEATITNCYVDTTSGGDWSTNDAAGWMQVVNVGPSYLTVPSQSALSTSTSGGSLPGTTTYYYVVTALGAQGETTVSNETTITTGAGSSNKVTITWSAVTGATGYRIYRGTSSGAQNLYWVVGAVTTYDNTTTTGTSGTPPTSNTATNSSRIQIQAGDKIYTAPNASGDLIATVSSAMKFSGLPSLNSLEGVNSQYEIISANFYGNTDWQAMYGCSGAGRAFAFDGNYLRYIYTGLQESLDTPRHLAFHNFHLVLGYGTGAALTSVAGSPEDFSGLNGAGEFDTGDPVTGLLRLNGTSLGIFCKSSIQILNGTDNTNFSMSVFNPYEGAIEYTVVDCGKPIWASYKGISTLDQSAAYGNFLGSRLSANITPWLLPRLTSTNVYTPGGPTESSYISSVPSRYPLFAIPVRNKNQYRLAFADGYWLTMTLQGTDLTPVFTIQKIATHRTDGDSVQSITLIPLARASTVDIFGKDRNFVSWYDGTIKLRGVGVNTDPLYIWELDRGWGFGAETPIPSWFTTTHNFFDNPFQITTIRDVRLHGLSLGEGILSVAVSADYLSNDFTNGNVYGQTVTNTVPQDISLPRDGGLNPYTYRAGDFQPQTNIAAVGKTGRSFSFQFSTPAQDDSSVDLSGKLYPPIVAQQLMFQISSGKSDIK